MIDLKELKSLAEASIKDCKMFEHTPRHLFNECASPELILQLIKEHQEMIVTLKYYANRTNWNNQHSQHSIEDTIHYTDIEHDLENECGCGGRMARQTLDGVSK